MKTRREHFESLFPEAPSFRWKQAVRALFDARYSGWREVTTLPVIVRETLHESLPWTSIASSIVLESRKRDTFKALIELSDGKKVETVLMRNNRGHWSVCVSSQVGCAMACSFCATGSMGFGRNLTEDEIVDQYRFWNTFLVSSNRASGHISNVVFMGMGEPMANYDAVRASLQALLDYTSLGPTRITVSTVGLLPALRRLIADTSWPPVRLAVSLHSAELDVRRSIMPSTAPKFFDELAEWAGSYFRAHPSRRNHLTFEYVLLRGVNDGDYALKQLAQFSRRIGKVRVNLIPYNATGGRFKKSGREMENMVYLKQVGIPATLRKTMGDDIAAACGQLAGEKSHSKKEESHK